VHILRIFHNKNSYLGRIDSSYPIEYTRSWISSILGGASNNNNLFNESFSLTIPTLDFSVGRFPLKMIYWWIEQSWNTRSIWLEARQVRGILCFIKRGFRHHFWGAHWLWRINTTMWSLWFEYCKLDNFTSVCKVQFVRLEKLMIVRCVLKSEHSTPCMTHYMLRCAHTINTIIKYNFAFRTWKRCTAKSSGIKVHGIFSQWELESIMLPADWSTSASSFHGEICYPYQINYVKNTELSKIIGTGSLREGGAKEKHFICEAKGRI